MLDNGDYVYQSTDHRPRRPDRSPRSAPHALRHTFVTLSLNEGVSLRNVQDAARHADPRTTRRYDRDRHSLARHPTHRLLGALDAF